MTVNFKGKIFYWKGPAPHYFVRLPEAESNWIKSLEKRLTYGWGCISVEAKVGVSEFQTSLIPKDGFYLLPIKLAVRKAENLQDGDEVTAQVLLRLQS